MGWWIGEERSRRKDSQGRHCSNQLRRGWILPMLGDRRKRCGWESAKEKLQGRTRI